MSKKMKLLIGLIIALLIIGLILGCATIYRFCKIQNILSDVNENIEKDNYYMKTIITNNGKTLTTETYYKNGIGKFVSQEGVYTWFDGENAYTVDETNKQATKLALDEAMGLVFNNSFASLYPCYSKNAFQKLLFAGNLSNSIKTENYNGEKCTVFRVEEENCIKTYWITNKWSNLIKAEVEFPNGDKYEYKYEIKFHITKLKDIELPDFSDYTITYNTESANADNANTEDADAENINQVLEPQNVIVENVVNRVIDSVVG